MDVNESASNFLELSSWQRLAIIQILQVKKSKLSTLAKELDATPPEVFRNLERMEKNGLVKKIASGQYTLTEFGKTVLVLIPSITFVTKNREYFKDHELGEIPEKFIQRIGSLSTGKMIKGYTRVIENWKQIFDNANEYVYGILVEEPLEIIEPLVNKSKKGVKINSIFSDFAVLPKGRKKILKKSDVKKLIQDGMIERKIKKNVKSVVVLNENEACVMFPRKGEPDISKSFYSDDSKFHEWCLDYFRYLWYGSEVFLESKLKENEEE